MSILRTQNRFTTYNVTDYEWAYKAYEAIQSTHWRANEIPLGEDVVDFAKLPKEEQNFITNILRLFTQNDVQAIQGYVKLIGLVKPVPIQMMLAAFMNTEAIHVDAYSLLTDTLGFDSAFYEEFFDIPVMERKIDYLEKAKVKKYEDYKELGLSDAELDKRFRKDILRMVAVYAAGLEGIELMAEFMLLLSYQQLGLFKGMSQINFYSIVDEMQHVTGNSMLFLQLKRENYDVYDSELEQDIINAIKQIVEQEDAMLDFLYTNGKHPNITKEEAKAYIRFMADRALTLLELPKQYGSTNNPIKFMDELLSAVEFSNFFESKSTAYAKGGVTGDITTLKHNPTKRFLQMRKEV